MSEPCRHPGQSEDLHNCRYTNRVSSQPESSVEVLESVRHSFARFYYTPALVIPPLFRVCLMIPQAGCARKIPAFSQLVDKTYM